MKNLILLTCFTLLSQITDAKPILLLDCSLPDGDTQQARVMQEGESLILIELDNRGTFSKRPLSHVEWNSKVLTLKTHAWAKSTLSLSNNGWWFSYKSDGYNAMGFASCN